MAEPIVVVGAGVFGSFLAYRLVCDGADVVLVEQESPGHARATSSGDTRLVRFAHGDDLWGVESVRRSVEAWRELERTTGVSLLVQTGLVWFAREADGWEALSAKTLEQVGVRVERLEPEQLRDWYPSVDLTGIDWVLHELDAGAIRARAALPAIVSAFLERGGRLVRGHATYSRTGLLVDGAPYEASKVVWACGPWLKSLFPELAPLMVTRIDEYYVAAPQGEDWRATSVPGWLDFDRGMYGVGDLDGLGIKCGVDTLGVEVDPDTFDRVPDPDSLRRARGLMGARFPSLANAPVVGTRVCQYEFTSDSNFLLGEIPDSRGRQWLMGGGSGQGFKHAPSFAQLAADALAERSPVDSRFALGPRGGPSSNARTAASRTELHT